MAPPPRPPSDSVSVLTRWTGVGDANTAGSIHGGRIMYLCDEVAGIAAIRHSGCRVVTAGVDRMLFRHPVLVGDLVTVRATVNAAWRTSMEVGVRVEREQVRTREVEHTSTAYLTDEERRPMEVPPIESETEEERRRRDEAELRRRNRLTEREEILTTRAQR